MHGNEIAIVRHLRYVDQDQESHRSQSLKPHATAIMNKIRNFSYFSVYHVMEPRRLSARTRWPLYYEQIQARANLGLSDGCSVTSTAPDFTRMRPRTWFETWSNQNKGRSASHNNPILLPLQQSCAQNNFCLIKMWNFVKFEPNSSYSYRQRAHIWLTRIRTHDGYIYI